MIKKFRQLKSWQKILILVISIGLLGAIISPNRSKKTVQQKRTNCNMASVIAKTYVIDGLKAPASAKFPVEFSCIAGDSSTFNLSSYVDAENSFGASLRTRFNIKIRYLGGTDADPRNWKVINLTFLK